MESVEAAVPFLERHRRGVHTAYWCAVVPGSLLVGILLGAADLDLGVQRWMLVLWVASVVCLGVAVDILWGLQMAKALGNLTPLLYRDPDRYMRGVRVLLDGKRRWNNIRLINLSAAWMEKGDDLAAKDLLRQVRERKLSGINRAVYRADAALNAFHLGDDREALSALEEHRKLLDGFRGTEHLGGTLAVLDVYRTLAEGDREAAAGCLAAARARWTEERFQKEYAKLEERLAEL